MARDGGLALHGKRRDNWDQQGSCNHELTLIATNYSYSSRQVCKVIYFVGISLLASPERIPSRPSLPRLELHTVKDLLSKNTFVKALTTNQPLSSDTALDNSSINFVVELLR